MQIPLDLGDMKEELNRLMVWASASVRIEEETSSEASSVYVLSGRLYRREVFIRRPTVEGFNVSVQPVVHLLEECHHSMPFGLRSNRV